MPSSPTTTTTTMRSSQRVLLEAFPAPPSHIPQGLSNPPPSGPPSMPLPPVPGPSRVSVDEQLLFLSSVAQRSRRSSRYSNRESIISVGSGGHGSSPGTSSQRTSVVGSGSPITKVSGLPPLIISKRDSVASTRSSPRSPSFFPRPSISISAAPSSNIRVTPTEQFTRLAISPMLLSDIEDDETDVIPARIPSPFLDSSWRRSKHHHNESISSIDVRDILGVDADGTDEPVDDPPPIFSRRLSSRLSPSISHEGGTITPFSQLDSLPTTTVTANSHSFTTMPMQPPDNGASSSDTSSSTISATSSSTSISEFEAALSSTTVKDLRLERRSKRTKSTGLKKELAVRSRSRSRAGNRTPVSDASERRPSVSSLGLESDTASTKTAVPAAESVYKPRKEAMTLEELGPLPAQPGSPPKVKKTPRSRASTVSHASVAFPVQNDLSPSQTEMPRTPSPDIDTILSSTPRPAFKKSSRTRVRSQGNIRDRASHPTSSRRRASEGILPDGRVTMSWHGHGPDGSELPYLERNTTWSQSRPGYDEELEKTLEGSTDEFSDRTRRTHKKRDNGEESDSSIDLHTPLPCVPLLFL